MTNFQAALEQIALDVIKNITGRSARGNAEGGSWRAGCPEHGSCLQESLAVLSALLQVDLTNFKAALGQNALDVIEIIIGRSASMAANVKKHREALGGLAALRREGRLQAQRG